MKKEKRYLVGFEFLKSHPLFGGITDRQLESIRKFLKEEQFAKGECILREGDLGDRLYFIEKGSVEILKKDPSSEQAEAKRIATLGAGDTFGEMALIDMEPRCATVRALEKTVALNLTCKDLYEISKSDLQAFTMLIMNLAREIGRRLREMDDRFVTVLFSSE